VEGAVIVVPSLSGDADAVCVDDPLEVASSVDGVELSRVEGVPHDAECGVDTPQAVPQQANEAVAVGSDLQVDERALIAPLSIPIAPPQGDVLVERTLGVPVAYNYAPPPGDVLMERTHGVPAPIFDDASSYGEMSSVTSGGQLPPLAQPDARLVFNLLVRIVNDADEPAPVALAPAP
jgi:hypothetical protein